MAMPALDSLMTQVDGTVVRPGDEAYEEARHVYNAMIDAHPAGVVRCAGTADVVATVRCAAESGSPLAVRGGGHSVPGFGTADDAVVADLSGMQAVDVDDERRTATVGGGATWGRFNDVTAAHGLATTGGIVSTTGVGGLTLGGGIGYLARGYGLSCDNLLSAEVVTADGTVVTASASEHPDLFWALQGGGGNFGVVTRFTFRLHPVTTVLGGPMFFELADGPAALAHFRDFIRTAPREYGGFPAFQIAPPLPFVPEDRVGEPFVAVVSCWTGSAAEGEQVLDGLRQVARPVAEHVGPMPYAALNSAFDGLVPAGLQHYWKAAFVRELTDDAIAAHMEHGPKVPTVNSTVHLYPINGAVHDVAAEATAFGHRDASFAPVIAGMWPDPADNERNTAWVREYHAAIAPHSEEGGYVNFASADDQPRAGANYGANHGRLREVKRRYDPDNLFHLNQNIQP
ncbi:MULTISPECIES: FAD-binding oxidoreductase [unclassified Modestobacter]|uniref:FAD-binding oxidoreductase n=1 Tax=unclassified Modestobacter TaxID=2643866 RepID=UPI0022AAA6D1|nr:MULTISPECIES: FAD-binding oxidoreductase [unclassified Modestobacter]MCZ2826180.1 FAD-binding oxidoreductase [Modestobacter sp. VKM Ac-2981]MCZ2852755.1 FAD-binding oxidoreductase [Modestobacter sp. VKM Ac-2982]